MRETGDWEKHLSELPLGSGGFSMKSMQKVKEKIALQEKKKRAFRPIAAVAALCALAVCVYLTREEWTAWFAHPPESKPVFNENEDVTLRVQYQDPASFLNIYGRPFVIRHPSVRFETASPTQEQAQSADAYINWAEEQRLDLLQLPLAYVDDLAKAGYLASLDLFVERDGYDLNALHEPVVRTIREAGAGELFGLAPEFNSYGLYYNQTLFEERGVPLPRDGMSWTEVLQTAARFGGETADGQPVYGLSFGWRSAPASVLLDVGRSVGLRPIAADGATPTVDTPAWRELWEAFALGYREGWLHQAETPAVKGSVLMRELYRTDPFLTGRSAMAFQDAGYLDHIVQAREDVGFADEWRAATQPVDPARPDQAGGFAIPVVYAIRADSPNKEAAWELLKSMMSAEQAQREIRMGYQGLFTNRAAVAADDPRTVFYRMSADAAATLAEAELWQTPGYAAVAGVVRQAGQQLADAVVAGDRTVPDALAELQAQAEAAALLQRQAQASGEAARTKEGQP